MDELIPDDECLRCRTKLDIIWNEDLDPDSADGCLCVRCQKILESNALLLLDFQKKIEDL